MHSLSLFSHSIFRHANLILNLFSLMVDANVPDIALEPDKTVKKVCLWSGNSTQSFYNYWLYQLSAWLNQDLPNEGMTRPRPIGCIVKYPSCSFPPPPPSTVTQRGFEGGITDRDCYVPCDSFLSHMRHQSDWAYNVFNPFAWAYQGAKF